MTRILLCGSLCAFAAFCAEPAVENWPQFRGPAGLGLGSDKASLPSEFGPGKALLWKTALPLGHGSPSIWGDRIFVTGFDSTAKKLEVIAVDRKSGNIAWHQTIPTQKIEDVHSISSPATSTPVTDGEKIYVYSGSYGMLAYDWNGKLTWEYTMDAAKCPYGSGVSPVLAGEIVVITRDYLPAPFLLAIKKKDGSMAWKTDLVKLSQMGPGSAHSTPLIWNGQIVLNRPGEVSAYAPQDGRRLWGFPTASGGTSSLSGGDGVVYVNAPGLGTDAYTVVKMPAFSVALSKYDADNDGKLKASEVPANDLFFMKRTGMPDNIQGAHFNVKLFFGSLDANKDGFIDENEYNMIEQFLKMVAGSKLETGILSIRPTGEGTLAPSALQWSARGAGEVTTPLEYRNRVYSITAGGIISCVDAKTGKMIYRGRVNAPGAYFASPVAGGGKLFVASAEGVVSVLAGGETLEVLANNDLGEPVYGTPAIVASAIYVRSSTHLWAFGSK